MPDSGLYVLQPMRLLRGVVALSCVLLVLLVTFDPIRDRLSDVAVDHVDPVHPELLDPVYLVEVAPPPDHRLVANDPSSATTTPIFVVPEYGAIVSIALSPDRKQLALSYTKDYNVPGTGIYILDLAGRNGQVIRDDGDLLQVTEELPKGFYDDLQFAPDGTTVWATVDDANGSAVVEVDLATGETRRTLDNAVDPAVGERWVAYLEIESDYSRRSIGMLDLETDATSTITVLDGNYDLDHLVADSRKRRLLIAALVPANTSPIEIGEPAQAHGTHDDPAQWLTLDLRSGEVRRLAEHEPMSVRDAALLTTGELAVATAEGLQIVASPSRTIVASGVITDLAG